MIASFPLWLGINFRLIRLYEFQHVVEMAQILHSPKPNKQHCGRGPSPNLPNTYAGYVVNAVPLNELSKEMFVYKVLDEMMSRQMYGLAEQVVSCVGIGKVLE